jgi:phage replication O-like protein O
MTGRFDVEVCRVRHVVWGRACWQKIKYIPADRGRLYRLANELLEAIISASFSSQELRIIFVVARRTYGWNKSEDFISLSQFVGATGMTVKRCSQVISRLTGIKVISVINKSGLRGMKKYRINKNYEECTLSKKRHSQKNESVRKTARHSHKNESVHSHKNESTKERFKDIIQKTNDDFV